VVDPYHAYAGFPLHDYSNACPKRYLLPLYTKLTLLPILVKFTRAGIPSASKPKCLDPQSKFRHLEQ